MSNFIRLDRRKHESFLADQCIDPTTKELLKVGDEICICANCKSPNLKSVWELAKRCPTCGDDSKRTLSEIPKTKYLNYLSKKNTSNSFKGYFFFFLFTTIILAITTFLLYSESQHWKNSYHIIYNEKEKLNYEISELSNIKSKLSEEKTKIQLQLKDANSKLVKFEELKNIASNLYFITGVNYKDREDYSLGYGNNEAKIFFTINYPIIFKSVKLDAVGSGYLTGYIYDLNDTKICEAYNGEITTGVETLSFNCILEKGSYYLTHSGNVSMRFIENFNKYPISDGIISITGTQYKSNYYMNFFEWKYKLKID